MSNKKSIIKEAVADIKAIKQYAKEEAVKQLEEKIQPKIEEMLDKKINESVNIETEDASIEVTDTGVTVEKDGTTVSVDNAEGSEMDSEFIDTPVAGVMDAIVGDEEPSFETEEETEEEPVEDFSDEGETEDEIEAEEETEDEASEEEDEEETEEETLFEVVQFEEEEIELEEPAAAAEEPAIEEPALEEPAMEEPAVETPEANVTLDLSPLVDMMQKVLDKLEGGSPEGEEGEVEVIDDTTAEEPALEEPAMEEPAVEEEPEAIQEFELSEFEETFSEGDLVDEGEIVGETEELEEEDSVEEQMGVGHLAKNDGRSAGKLPREVSHKLKENTAQNESDADELIKENKGLKKDISEFQEAFIMLRDQLDEMQNFNAKLALANKVFLNGGLTTDEKHAISEEFDAATTVKEATEVYHRIIKEHKISLKESTVSKIKSKNINVGKSKETAKPLYESAQAKVLKESTLRQQRLAGIIKNED